MVDHRWWHGFISRGTIISGLISLLFWGQTLGWAAGSIVLVLLFVHELGHILGARARKMTIQGAPIFIPGLGAFVRVEPTANVWDEVVMVLGGPVIGGAVALLAGVAGVFWQIPALAFAGSFGLLLNLSNLLPLVPFDGGRLAARTGWLGYLPTLALGGLLLWSTIMGRRGPLIGLLACIGLYWGYLTMRSGLTTPRSAQVVIFLLHLITVALLLVASIGISRGEDRFIPSAGQLTLSRDGNRLITGIGLAALVLFGIASVAQQIAFRPGCNRTLRYTLLALVCWPSFLFGHPRIIPGLWCLFAQQLGLPGLIWLATYIRRLVAGGHPAAGFLCAYGYDFQREAEAEVWLDAMVPTIRDAGEHAVLATAAVLSLLGHHDRALRWIVSVYDGVAHESLSCWGASSLAAGLRNAGRAVEGLPYARTAVASNRHGTTLGNLGEILHDLGQQDEAEEVLHESLRLNEHCRYRLVIAKVFAAQGRYVEAIAAADHVLRAHKDSWFESGPTAVEVRVWIQNWLTAAAQASASPDQPPTAPATPEADLVAR